jgi:hypothetical protein
MDPLQANALAHACAATYVYIHSAILPALL